MNQFINVFSILIISLISACRPVCDKCESRDASNVHTSEIAFTAESVDGSHSYLKITFYDGCQYVADYSTDVGGFNGVKYSGYYIKFENAFSLMSPLHGTVDFEAGVDGVYMPRGVAVEEALNSGLRLKIKE